jgi:putative endonuclease
VSFKQAVGREGEHVAAAHLESDGMVVLARNWRCPQGEIDVIALDGDCLVVCEVKTRRSVRAGLPAEAVVPAKVARLRRLAAAWLAEQDRVFREVRLDVVAVVRPPGSPPQVEHLRGVA